MVRTIPFGLPCSITAAGASAYPTPPICWYQATRWKSKAPGAAGPAGGEMFASTSTRSPTESGGAPLPSDTRTRAGIISAGGTPLPFSRTASSTTRTLSGNRWMSAMRPSTLMLNSGRERVGAASSAVRHVARPKPKAAARRPIPKARACPPAGARNSTTIAPAPNAGPSHIGGSAGSSK